MGYFLKSPVTFKDWLRRGIIIVLSLSLITGYVGWQLVRPANRGVGNKAITILPGLSVEQISQQLESSGLIKSSFWFKIWLRFVNKETKIVSGYYSLPGNVNIINLTYLLTGGQKMNNEVEIRFVEGWTINQMADYLETNNIIKSEDFIKAVAEANSSKVIVEQINSELLKSWPGGSLEGYLFPDTYRIYRNSSASDIAVKMLQTLATKFSNEWQEILEKRGLSIHQAITLASIVEKEVSNPDDQKKVADIFLKRLKANMALQADSTINFITGKSDSAVQAVDLNIDSPYNTYKYRGLPPGPISNPGLSAIRAVVFPMANDYWYFLTTPDAKVIYSRTYTEHKTAKAKYLQ